MNTEVSSTIRSLTSPHSIFICILGSRLRLASWIPLVWGWPRIHIFHSWHLPRNFLLVTFCDLTAETGVSFRTNRQNGTNGWTDRRESWNSYQDNQKLPHLVGKRSKSILWLVTDKSKVSVLIPISFVLWFIVCTSWVRQLFVCTIGSIWERDKFQFPSKITMA